MEFGALSDIRVVDLTGRLAGSYATMILADHGADVIKVEPPEVGDATRGTGPFLEEDTEQQLGGFFQSVNRNKKSVVLDLKSEEGKEALKALIKDADAITENYRAGVMDRLGLSYEVLKEINPRLVYGTLRGFGDPRTGESPYGKWPSYDVVAQAMGGIMGITGPDAESPTKIGPGIGDIAPGMMLAFGVLMGVHNARRTGKGQFVDISMVDSVLSVCERIVYQYSVQNVVAKPEGNMNPFHSPFGIFPAKDGHVTIAAPLQEDFDKVCEVLGAPELKEDERFTDYFRRREHKAALETLLSEVTRRFTKQELNGLLGGLVPFGPVMHMDEIDRDSHFAAREMVVPVEVPGVAKPMRIAGVPIKMTETPGGVHSRAPLLGEHTEQVLREAGVSEDIINKMRPE